MTLRQEFSIEDDDRRIKREIREAIKNYTDAEQAIEKAGYLLNEGQTLTEQQKYNEAILVLDKAGAIYRGLGIYGLEEKCLLGISNITYNKTFDYDMSIKVFNRILEISIEPFDLSSVHSCLATLHITNRDYIKAIEHASASLQLSKEVADTNLQSYSCATALYNLGEAHMLLKNIEKAKEFIKDAFEKFKELEYVEGQAKCLSAIGMLYCIEEQYAESLDYYNKALEIFEDTDNSEEVAETLKSIAASYIYLKRFKEASELLVKTASIHRELGQLSLAAETLLSVAKFEVSLLSDESD